MSQKPQRAIKRAVAAGRDDYELHDQEWQKIGLAAPARRALIDAKLYKVSDLRKITLTELTAMHGMGKSAIARIKVIMEAKKISFR
ncbi:MAG: hypothetical protein RL569_2 [Actinomycetota bacterium]|jgi:hypothetical protein